MNTICTLRFTVLFTLLLCPVQSLFAQEEAGAESVLKGFGFSGGLQYAMIAEPTESIDNHFRERDLDTAGFTALSTLFRALQLQGALHYGDWRVGAILTPLVKNSSTGTLHGKEERVTYQLNRVSFFGDYSVSLSNTLLLSFGYKVGLTKYAVEFSNLRRPFYDSIQKGYPAADVNEEFSDLFRDFSRDNRSHGAYIIKKDVTAFSPRIEFRYQIMPWLEANINANYAFSINGDDEWDGVTYNNKIIGGEGQTHHFTIGFGITALSFPF